METTEVNTRNWKSLIKPAKLEVKLSDDKSHAKILAEPTSLNSTRFDKDINLPVVSDLTKILLKLSLLFQFSISA